MWEADDRRVFPQFLQAPDTEPVVEHGSGDRRSVTLVTCDERVLFCG